MKLYTYDHCPFCTRARMIFGLKNQPLDNQYLPSDDETTPIGLIGKKMLPILIKADGSAMGESLDIVRHVDEIGGGERLHTHVRPAINAWLDKVDAYQRYLVWPRCIRIGLAEFATPSAVDYFVAKKSAVIGDFEHHYRHSAEYIARLNQDLAELATLMARADQANGQAGEEDILLFPLLRNLSMVNGVSWPETVRHYMDDMAKRSGVPLFWRQVL